MLDYKKIFSFNPFSMAQSIKKEWYFKNIKTLTMHHYNHCKEFRKISDTLFKKIRSSKSSSELPFIHSKIFKQYNLKSTAKNNLTNILTSSGTTGIKKSQINLDFKTSIIQSRALTLIYQDIIKDRDTCIFFIDSPNVTKGVLGMSARGAAIKGFGQLVKKKYFLLDSKYNLKIKTLLNFIKKNPKKKFIIFGFTSFVWDYFLKILKKKKIKIPKNDGLIIHGGGWKKMTDKSINKERFNSKIFELTNIKKVHNYYGMVEQTGSIFIECEHGFFHSSIFSEIYIRDNNLNLADFNKHGIIQTLSLLPTSYPGHNILTEDIGKIEGYDNCKCGRRGKFFSIKGRVQGTELRGCSDVY